MFLELILWHRDSDFIPKWCGTHHLARPHKFFVCFALWICLLTMTLVCGRMLIRFGPEMVNASKCVIRNGLGLNVVCFGILIAKICMNSKNPRRSGAKRWGMNLHDTIGGSQVPASSHIICSLDYPYGDSIITSTLVPIFPETCFCTQCEYYNPKVKASHSGPMISIIHKHKVCAIIHPIVWVGSIGVCHWFQYQSGSFFLLVVARLVACLHACCGWL